MENYHVVKKCAHSFLVTYRETFIPKSTLRNAPVVILIFATHHTHCVPCSVAALALNCYLKELKEAVDQSYKKRYPNSLRKEIDNKCTELNGNLFCYLSRCSVKRSTYYSGSHSYRSQSRSRCRYRSRAA